ncbi:MAG: hypothetical protein ACUVYA_10005, partial [Planctomycetota bacterium]
MEKVVFSVIVSVLLGAVVVLGIQVHRSGETSASRLEAASELARVQESLADLEEGVASLGERIRAVESKQTEIEIDLGRLESRAPVAAVLLDGEAKERAAALVEEPDRLKQYVFAAIAEERQLREAEREKKRQEMRQRMEERRKEMEALSEGPYERYNLKVNSMAKVLNLTESQRQSYYELTKGYSEKLEEVRRQLREKAVAARQAQEGGEARAEGGPGAEGGRGRGRGAFGAVFAEFGAEFRQATEAVQKQYAEQVLGLLTVSQAEVYNQLPEPTRNLGYLGMVVAPGEESAQFPGFLGGPGGAPGGFLNPGGNRGAPGNVGGARGGPG